jgi:hypothetical protein
VYSTHRVFDTYNDAVNAFKANKDWSVCSYSYQSFLPCLFR